tara:strand:+ start:1061 stop:1258 length:198 start_codon:yes stop_codon:yes gene_type:complete
MPDDSLNYEHAMAWMRQELQLFHEEYGTNLTELGESYAHIFNIEEIPDWVWDAAFDAMNEVHGDF